MKPGFYKRHKLGLLSFFIPFFILLTIFAGRHIYPFGEESFLHSDMYHQYMPFFAELMHKLKRGENLYYSWNIGLGSNFLALFVYYLASPFNWLLRFVSEPFLMEFMTGLILVKISVCGLTFGIYLRRHFHTKSYLTVLFSTLYALSGFIAAYNWDIMWLDNVILAPLIILGLERLVFQKKYLLYCVTLALSILSNYYISIMICIYLVLYFIVLILSHPRQLRAVFPFAGCSLLSGGLSAILLLPELSALSFTEFSEIRFPDHLSSYFSVLDMLARHFVNVTTEQGLNHWPNLYCGVVILLLLPLYVLNKRIRLSEKISRLALLFFLLVSFSTNVLNFIWHGLNYPDSLPCRQSFLYILLMLTLCYEALVKLRAVSVREIVFVFWGAFFFVMLCERVTDNKAAFPASAFLMTYVLLAVYLGLLLGYHHLHHHGLLSPDRPMADVSPAVSSIWGRQKKKLTFQQLLALTATLIVVLESGMNMAVTSVSTTSRSKYLSGHGDYQTLVARTRQNDPDFYRFEKFSRVTKNDGALSDYPTASLFSSTGNSYVGSLYEKLGMSYSKVFYCYDGATPLSAALLSVRYLFSDSLLPESGLYELADSEGDIYLYRNRYALPLGYMLTGAARSEAVEPLSEPALLDDFTPLETQNRIAAAFSDKTPLFFPVSADTDEKTTLLTAEASGHYYAYVNNSAVRTVTAHFQEEKKEFKRLNHNYILDLGWLDAGSSVSLISKENEDLALSAYRLNEEALREVIRTLQKQTMTVDSYDSRSVNGHIRVAEPGLLVLSIPYEPGWSMTIDGVKTQPERFADTFLAVPLASGDHTIALRYYPTGLTAGILISAVSLAILLVLVVTSKKRR